MIGFWYWVMFGVMCSFAIALIIGPVISTPDDDEIHKREDD